MQQRLMVLFAISLLPYSISALTRLKERYAWSQVDFTWPTPALKERAIQSGMFKPENVLPLGVEAGDDRLVITLPRLKPGLPATLATVPRHSEEKSPKLKPFPNWKWHHPENCDALVSVFRVNLDSCNRLWVMDSGAVDTALDVRQQCPPKLLVFDFNNDTLLLKYVLPEDQVKDGSLFANIVVDQVNENCGLDAFAYISDVFRFGLVVYDMKTNTSRRIEHEYFYPDPLAAKFDVSGLQFRWPDGLFGLALSPTNRLTNQKTLYFHPMASFREFAISTQALRNMSAYDDDIADMFQVFDPRGTALFQSSTEAMSENGVLFYNLVSRNAVGCWNSRLPYKPENQGIVDSDNKALVFPNDIRVDKSQNIWVLSDRFPQFIYQGLNTTDINFRVLCGSVMDLVRGGVCDPRIKPQAKKNKAKSSWYRGIRLAGGIAKFRVTYRGG